jgi:uncharacterized protein (DUF433 family)
MTIPAELKHILSSDPEVMGGDICFTGTRIPVVMLLDSIADGVSLEEFYEDYPSLTPEHVNPVLEWENQQAKRAMGLELVG